MAGTTARREESNVSLDELQSIDDLRIKGLKPLLPPSILLDELPLSEVASSTVVRGRRHVTAALRETDDRLIVVVGPCSIHDPDAGYEYATKLVKVAKELSRDLIVVMRVYFEKPRTTVGWKGLINDPDLDNTFNINKGLRKARELLCRINDLGLPCGCEFLDTITPQFFADLVTWGAIGARTTESQIHRELSSGLSMPVGFKNSTSGDVQIACDAVQAALNPHSFPGVTKQGLVAIVHTRGNPFGHIILRGSATGTNYDKDSVEAAAQALKNRKVKHPKVIVDCSHGNSRKKYQNQPVAAREVCKQIAGGSRHIAGVMLESHLLAGNQKLNPERLQDLVYGKSITDECLGFDETMEVLKELAEAVQCRRKRPREE